MLYIWHMYRRKGIFKMISLHSKASIKPILDWQPIRFFKMIWSDSASFFRWETKSYATILNCL